MKKMLLTYSALIIMLYVNAQTELLTIAENNLLGPVRSVVTNTNWLTEKFGEWENASEYWKESAEFNKAGLLTASSKTESKFEISNSFTYNKKGQLVQRKEVFGKEGDKKKLYIQKYTYDDKGHQTVLDFYGDDGDLSWKEKRFYNENGTLKEIFTYDGEGDLIKHASYTYNNSGTLKSIIEKNSKKETIKTNEFEYDRDGNRTKEMSYEKYGNYKKTLAWTYENGVKTSQKKTTVASNGIMHELITFDANGNEKSLSNLEKYNRETVYTYDSHNNWVTATFSYKDYEGKEAKYRIVRVIKYY